MPEKLPGELLEKELEKKERKTRKKPGTLHSLTMALVSAPEKLDRMNRRMKTFRTKRRKKSFGPTPKKTMQRTITEREQVFDDRFSRMMSIDIKRYRRLFK